ncbi:MAG TPA: 2-dehydropantoate 2-reductase [Spirochaetota bacterium]|nr:2-dehydropantoate 2-reductase [Spirochaetota bacterium]HOM09741.1 2-dehydropantoate 2-reductase [Spirochaetota bacterium]HPP49359.1 2-dehydropantoate 2-reductase [Spirochaetota bacterium]HXK65501.1 2-dehydropantoate 2-reductase [Spirochaetota bacterium]
MNNKPIIGIVGAGAMGSLFAFFLGKYTILLYDTNPNTVNAIKQGLSVEIHSEKQTFYPTISNDPAILASADIIFLFIKSFATRDAIDTIQHYIKPDAIVVTLQNGIGNVELISSMINNPLVYGTTTIGATKLSPASVRFGGTGSIIIGGDSYSHCSTVHSLLQNANLTVTIAPDPKKALWEKAIINAAINPLGALLEVPNGKLIENNNTVKIMAGIIQEACLVAQANGIMTDSNHMIETTTTVCRNTQNNFCSMLQDILAKRKTEIDSINGAIITFAQQYSIDTPYNTTVYKLIKYKESQLI